MPSRRQVQLLVLLGVLTVVCAGAEPAFRRSRDITFPVYANGLSHPVAVVKGGTVRRDLLQKGFLKIGLFPVVVVEELQLELLRPDKMEGTFDRIARVLAGRKRVRGLEIRGFSLRTKADTTPALELSAEKVSHYADGIWRLEHVRFNNARHRRGLLIFEQGRPHLRLSDGSTTNLLNPQPETVTPGSIPQSRASRKRQTSPR